MTNFFIVIIALFVYVLSVVFKITLHQSNIIQRNADIKLIPADIVFITIPINIANAINPKSLFRYINNETQSVCYLILLILLSFLFYIILVYNAHNLQKEYERHPVGDLKDKKNIFQFICAFIFFVGTCIIAGL